MVSNNPLRVCSKFVPLPTIEMSWSDKDNVRPESLELWRSKKGLGYHGNASAYKSRCEPFSLKTTSLLCYPPDETSCSDFFRLAKMKLKLKRRRFDTIKESQTKAQAVLRAHLKGLWGMFPFMAAPLATLYRRAGWPCQRRQSNISSLN